MGPKIIKRVAAKSTLTPNDRPIVAGSARAKAQQTKRIKDRAGKAKAVAAPKPRRNTSTTTTTIPKTRGFPKLKSAAQKREDELKKIN